MKNIVLSIVFPVYNNGTTIRPMVDALLQFAAQCTPLFELVALDDASSDDSQQTLKRYYGKHSKVRLLFHETNQGSAKTFQELYESAYGKKVLLFSIDGEWDPADVPAMFHASRRADVVIGERKTKAYRWGRKLVSYLYNKLILLLFGVTTYDAGSNKVVAKEIIHKVPIISHGVFNEAERLIRAQKLGYTITSVPIAHRKTKKLERLFPRFDLMAEALVDCARVFWSLRTT